MQSRVEDILMAIINGTDSSQLPPPQSRNEALLIRILDKINGGGGSGGKLPIHICAEGEYSVVTGMPTVQNPEDATFYLVPGGEGNNLFTEWVYVDNAWELFGGGGGSAENGLPSGGTVGQILKKTGDADYAAGWSDVALNDLSDVNVSPSKEAVLTYQPGIRKWLAGRPSPFQIGEIYEHYDEELQDLDGKGYIDLTGGAENPSGNPVFSSYCYDNTSIHVPTDGLFEVYWTTNTENDGLKSIYLVDRAAGTPFDHALYRYDYDVDYGIWVEAPLANANEVTGMWTGTQAQYDALATKDAHTVYFIQE